MWHRQANCSRRARQRQRRNGRQWWNGALLSNRKRLETYSEFTTHSLVSILLRNLQLTASKHTILMTISNLSSFLFLKVAYHYLVCRRVGCCETLTSKTLANGLVADETTVLVVWIAFRESLIDCAQVQVDSIIQVESGRPIFLRVDKITMKIRLCPWSTNHMRCRRF